MPDHSRFRPDADTNPGHSPLRRHTPTPHPDTFIEDYSHVKPGIWPFPDKLHVMVVMVNPPRFRARYELLRAMTKRVNDASAILHVCEVAFGGRHFEVTDPNNPHHLQLRTTSEIWLKENAINLLIAHARKLYPDMKYVAWIDADISFARADWAQETLHQLQHHDFVQMFSHAQNLGPDSEPIGEIQPSFLYSFSRDRPNPHDMTEGWDWVASLSDGCQPFCYYYPAEKPKSAWRFVHPGFCWAARVSALDAVGGLWPYGLIGSGDYVMATALIGRVDLSLAPEMPERYKYLAWQWQERAEKYIRRNVGYVPGLVNHGWHGKRAARLYDKRWKFLKVSGFDPDLDLKLDTQGLWQLTDRSIMLRDGLRDYGKLRNEDSIDA